MSKLRHNIGHATWQFTADDDGVSLPLAIRLDTPGEEGSLSIRLLVAVLCWLTPVDLVAAPADTTLYALQSEIAALAAELEGDVGAAVIHLETGQGAATRGDEPFFLASVYKLPIAIAVLRHDRARRHDPARAVGLPDRARYARSQRARRRGRVRRRSAPRGPGAGQ